MEGELVKSNKRKQKAKYGVQESQLGELAISSYKRKAIVSIA